MLRSRGSYLHLTPLNELRDVALSLNFGQKFKPAFLEFLAKLGCNTQVAKKIIRDSHIFAYSSVLNLLKELDGFS